VSHSTPHPAVRRAARVLALVPALAVTTIAGTALAAPPKQWETGPSVSPLYVIAVLVLIPLGLFVLITLLVYLPSMRRTESYRPGEVWRGEPTWFGGPRDGIDSVDELAPTAAGSGAQGTARGGTSGHW